MPKINGIQGDIVNIVGAYPYKQGQMFNLAKDAKGYLISATENSAFLLIIGDNSAIVNKKSISVDSVNEFDSIELYQNYFGSIISPFGKLLNSQHKTKGKLLGKQKIEISSPKILDRVKLSQPLSTGVLVIDTMIPIGKGQRELIIGDRTTGKTTIALNTIINQKDKNIKSIYIAIGQKRSSIVSFYQTLKDMKIHENTTIIFANPNSPAEQFFAPEIGMAMAETLAYKGQDVLVIIDDLTKHANIHREISLSIGKNPGREAYPADIFYQHSKLLEKAGRFNENYKNGSITCIPIVETIQGDISSLIPSNIISITDGQIFTSIDMFNNGEFPSININLSVSRTGSSVQSFILKKCSRNLRAQYASLQYIKDISEMSIDISKEFKEQIKDWNAINNILLQFGNLNYSEYQILILIELFRMKVIHELKDRIKFSVAFNEYCKKNDAAKKLISKIKNKDYDYDNEKLKEDIKTIFIPLVKIASGIKNDIITIIEYRKLGGGL